MGTLLALDIGGRRIGVAAGDDSIRIAHPLTTILVDGHELEQLTTLTKEAAPIALVIGYPRNQAGEPTAQTEIVETFARQLEVLQIPIVFQDESLTSVLAEQRLREMGKPYTKEMIDAEAATLILQDYLEHSYGQ